MDTHGWPRINSEVRLCTQQTCACLHLHHTLNLRACVRTGTERERERGEEGREREREEGREGTRKSVLMKLEK